ncbi:glycoside hydrolase family 66 protein [Enterococcus gallinarum]|uniref:glycoside hydrolase family 66 protein n=1 Tax=Enterococcus gallinarum TaxID=1353 RepID=UPI002DC003E9|nr:glycoside hydrolase family 66 protein [Enterococcus gallinarum]MEB5883142.1 glycoside hydrolase family 66 protein [Enterococcus gallinarum]
MEIKLAKLQFQREETIEVLVTDLKKGESITLEVFDLVDRVVELTKSNNQEDSAIFAIEGRDLLPSADKMKGFKIVATQSNGNQTEKKTKIIDVVESAYDTPRYGFISDFSNDVDPEKTTQNLRNLHINLVQYYDWMYRHHELVSNDDVYVDAMGKTIDNNKVKEFIDVFTKNGIKSFGYAAIYGAQPEYFEKHPEQLLYTIDQKPIKFLPQIAFMDINKECLWSNHIIEEFIKSLNYGFDGLHLDTYGFPKEARNYQNKFRDLRKDIPVFIDDLRQEMLKASIDKGLIFNNVNSWPIDAVSKTSVDANYVEVWSPHDQYYDLYNLLRDAKFLTPNKQTILSAYMHPFIDLNDDSEEKDLAAAELSTLYTMATIFSNGGFHLALGEENKVLTQAYYSDNTTLRSSFLEKLYRYYDFFVQNEKLLVDYRIIDETTTSVDGINGEITFSNYECSSRPEKDKIWVTVKKLENNTILNLINFFGSEHLNWNEKNYGEIKALEEIEIKVDCIGKRVRRVMAASPDFEDSWEIIEHEKEAKDNGEYCKFTLNKLQLWTTIYIEFEGE